MLSPEAPCFPEPPPDWPRFASIHLRALQRGQVAEIRVGDNDDVAAGPPSPPSGPPLGTCFSRRKLIAPSPPRPALTRMRARSWNTGLLRVGDGDDAALAARLERDLAVALGEDRVIAADARRRCPGGTSCRAGGRGSSRRPPSGRRRSSRRGAWPASRGRSWRSRDLSCVPLALFLLRRGSPPRGFFAAAAGFFAACSPPSRRSRVISICVSELR